MATYSFMTEYCTRLYFSIHNMCTWIWFHLSEPHFLYVKGRWRMVSSTSCHVVHLPPNRIPQDRYRHSFLLEGKHVQERWLTEGYVSRERWGQDTHLGLSGSKVSKTIFTLMVPLANVPACLWNDWENQIRLAKGLWKKCPKIRRCQRCFILWETGTYPEAAGENSKLLDEEHRSVEVTRVSHAAFSNSSSASPITDG